MKLLKNALTEVGSTLIMKVILLWLVFAGCATALIGDDFFIHYVKTFVNQSVSPCDNFYRHVCSRNMQNTDRYRGHAEKVVAEFIREGEQLLNATRESTLFEKIIKTLAGEETKAAFDNLPRDVQYDPLIRNGLRVVELYATLRERMQYVAAVGDLSIFAPRELMHEIIETAEKELQVSDAEYRSKVMRIFRETLATLNPEKYDEFMEGTYKEIFERLDEFFTATGALDTFNESNLLANLADLLTTLGKYEPGLLNLKGLAPSIKILPYRISKYNAFYTPANNSITFFDAALIVSANASIPAKLGTSGVTMGHEMFHSILRSENWTSDETLGLHTTCLASHMHKVCKEFQEGECHSGPLTYDEDGPDMEARHLLYKLMRDKLGDQLKKPFPNTDVTNEQMFFYAVAMPSCDQEDAHGKLNHRKWGDLESFTRWA